MGSNYSDTEKRQLIGEWFQNGGYDQLVINSYKTCTDKAPYSRADALAHIVEYFLHLPLEKQWGIYAEGGMERYITRGLAMEVKSSSSLFFHKYRKPLMRERELVNERGEIKYGDTYELSDGDELEGKMRCLRYMYENELDKIDKWLIEQKIFSKKKNRDIAAEFDIPVKDIERQWSALKTRLKRNCKGY